MNRVRPPKTSARRLSCVWACVVTLGACASEPSAFQRNWTAARDHYSARQYDLAAKRWSAASEVASSRRDRDEALFRRASALQRAGREQDAQSAFRELAQQQPPGHRSARGMYELSRMARAQGDRTGEMRTLIACLLRFPNETIARGAVRNLDLAARHVGGPERSLAEFERLVGKLPRGKVDEAARYARARALLELGRDEEARVGLSSLVDAYPYPVGANWDDALWHLALLAQRRGDAASALQYLRAMLSQREQSYFAGSYERATFARARYKSAELIWNSSQDPAAASREFERVALDHPTHSLADDGLWQAARAAKAAGDTERACDLVERLHDRPTGGESRYVGCGFLVCPNPTTGERECRSYIRRAHEQAPDRAESIE